MAQSTTLKEFEAVFPTLREALLEKVKHYGLPEEQLDWFKRVSRLKAGTPLSLPFLLARLRSAAAVAVAAVSPAPCADWWRNLRKKKRRKKRSKD